ncbi:hypothetical protein JW933_05920 [candidate division FCPU426 bacterium]|nr:hypothetical protein [candidate division FCPU426 bacterium]
MKRMILLLILLPLAPTAVWAADATLPPAESEDPPLDGSFWLIMQSRLPESSLLMYTSGFLGGYECALRVMKDALLLQPYDQQNLLGFMDTLSFPKTRTNMEIKSLIDRFYQHPENRSLPLSVAFTYAHQVLLNYPGEYSQKYLEDMRQQYSPP